MKSYQLKNLYGRRITPAVKIFMLVVLIAFGLSLAFTSTSQVNKMHADEMIVK
jgi:hypothetical protein